MNYDHRNWSRWKEVKYQWNSWKLAGWRYCALVWLVFILVGLSYLVWNYLGFPAFNPAKNIP